MSFKVQILADTTRGYQPAVRHSTRGRVWLTVATKKNLATAERIMMRVKTDSKNAFVRIRQVSASS